MYCIFFDGMSSNIIRKISLIGAGRLATNFAFSARAKGFRVIQICNRSREAGMKLAVQMEAAYVETPGELSKDADLYAVAVSDAAIPELAKKIRLESRLVIHFSGTVDKDALKDCSRSYGVLYSPQTFTMNAIPGFLGLPICIDANSEEATLKLEAFASVLSDKIFRINTAQRRMIHLSAIFAGNFTNFMYVIAESLLKENNLPMDLLEPIIEKTMENARRNDIFTYQTGPAVREDLDVIKSHLAILSQKPEFREIYDLMSRSIIEYKHHKQDDEL